MHRHEYEVPSESYEVRLMQWEERYRNVFPVEANDLASHVKEAAGHGEYAKEPEEEQQVKQIKAILTHPNLHVAGILAGARLFSEAELGILLERTDIPHIALNSIYTAQAQHNGWSRDTWKSVYKTVNPGAVRRTAVLEGVAK